MLVHLVLPPQFFPLHPNLAPLSLSAQLKAEGIDCRVTDLNNRFYRRVLGGEHLRAQLDYVKTEHGRLAKGPQSGAGDPQRRRLLQELAVVGDLVVERVPGSLAQLKRGDAFYEVETFARAYNVLHRALELALASHYPQRLNLKGYEALYSADSSRSILAATADPAHNPFLEDYQRFIAELVARPPDLLGISCASIYTQLVPSFTLAAMVRRALPELPIVMGGTAVSELLEPLTRVRELYDFVDAYVAYDGERALPQLAQALARGDERAGWRKIDNLIYLDSNEVVINRPFKGIELDTLLLPDYEQVRFDDYFLPEQVFALELSRGCSWNKCTFCPRSGPFSLPSVGYRRRSAQRVVDDMEQLVARYGARFFYFITETAEAGGLGSLAASIRQRGLQVQWYTWARLQDEFTAPLCAGLAEAGCVKLMFGYESAVPSVSCRMDKHVDLEAVPQIWANCRSAGIDIHLWNMTGFPGETEEEARRTYQTIIDHLPTIDSIGFSYDFSVFRLLRGSMIFERPEEYGIRPLPVPAEHDLSMKVPFAADAGLSEAEAELLAAELHRAVAAHRRFGAAEVQADHVVSFLHAARAKRRAAAEVPRPPPLEVGDWLQRRPRLHRGCALPAPSTLAGAAEGSAAAAAPLYLVHPVNLSVLRVPALAASFLLRLHGAETVAEILAALSVERQEPMATLERRLRPFFVRLAQEGLVDL